MTIPHIGDVERRARLAVRHRLLPAHRADDVAWLTDDLVALHSSDPATVFLSAAARMEQPAIEPIEAALYEHRSLLRHHAMRRTLWVMTPEVARRAHASSGRKVAATERRTLLKRLATCDEIDDAESWLEHAMDKIVAAVADAGSIMTKELGELLPELRVPIAYPGPRGTTVDIIAHTKVVQLAGFEGRVVRTRPAGTWIGSQYRWAPMTEWLTDGLDTLAEDSAAADLLSQWLSRFGPGTETDLVWWTGWTKTSVRRALAECGAVEVRLDSGDHGWVAASDEALDVAQELDDQPWAAVLPGLDPTVMGWKQREWYLDDGVAAEVFDRNGNAGPTILVNGRVVGGWVQQPDGSLPWELYADVPAGATVLIERELDRLREVIGEIRFKVRFPSPNQKRLLGADA